MPISLSCKLSYFLLRDCKIILLNFKKVILLSHQCWTQVANLGCEEYILCTQCGSQIYISQCYGSNVQPKAIAIRKILLMDQKQSFRTNPTPLLLNPSYQHITHCTPLYSNHSIRTDHSPPNYIPREVPERGIKKTPVANS